MLTGLFFYGGFVMLYEINIKNFSEAEDLFKYASRRVNPKMKTTNGNIRLYTELRRVSVDAMQDCIKDAKHD